MSTRPYQRIRLRPAPHRQPVAIDGRRRCLLVMIGALCAAWALVLPALGQAEAQMQNQAQSQNQAQAKKPPQTAAIPSRIVSTSPSITETLFALGLGDRVVGVSTFCRHPEAVAALPKVGTFLKPSAEIIASLRPELVFVHSGSNAAAAQLRTLGIRTASVERGSLSNLYDTIRSIGAAAGVPDRADRLVADLTASLARVKASVAGRPPRKVLIIVGRRTGTLSDLVAVGPGSYLNDLAALAGGTNVLADAKLEYPRISMETVIALAPDVIIDVGEMGQSPAELARRRAITEGLWAEQPLVQAVRARAVHAINDDAYVTPGPRIVDVARSMASFLHGVRVP